MPNNTSGTLPIGHPAFDERDTLLTGMRTKVYLVTLPEGNGFFKLVGIRLSLTSAQKMADTFSGAVIHRFQASK